MKNYVKTQLKA